MSALAVATAPIGLRPSTPEGELLAVVREAVSTGDERLIADLLKLGLVEMARAGRLQEIAFPAAHPDRYTRRLVYADPWCRFTIIAMTWSPGQMTALHDHAGVWCVEVVVDGDMQVVNYQLLDEDHFGHCRFDRRETIPAPAASSGSLIPPFEHHVFGNSGAAVSHTLHVYGGPMNRCNVFAPIAEGWWQRQHRELRYDA